MEYRVAIVADREFGERLSMLAERLHVWIVDTPANRPIVETLWAAQEDYSFEKGATIFSASPTATPEEIARDVLFDVDEHHGRYSHDPPWTAIEVYGCAPSPNLELEFGRYGARFTSCTDNGFLAVRQSD